MNMTCKIKNNGTSILNFRCLVLWWNRLMPETAPRLPPINVINSKKNSEMRHR